MTHKPTRDRPIRHYLYPVRVSGCLAITVLVVALIGPVAASDIVHRRFASTVLERDYAYNVYRPDGYGDAGLQYPVLYLLHGSSGDEYDWPRQGAVQKTADRLIASGVMPPVLIVMPGSQGWWVNGHAEAAETAFMQELLPHVDQVFDVIPERSGRLLAGVSGGGHGAVNLALKYPDRFAAAAAISPAVYTPLPPASSSSRQHVAFRGADGQFDPQLWKSLNYPAWLDAYKAQSVVVPFYIHAADHDVHGIAYHAAVLQQALRQHQPDAVEFRVVDGGHDWQLAAAALPPVLAFLLAQADSPRVRLPAQ